ncbi:hypothetical protein DWUX_1347 [Desulfovibrio diazotrophicus]|nr:hypothetical protein DWUX_1347 [Desulfovibrio diazotrophicus]
MTHKSETRGCRPFTGAWIETNLREKLCVWGRSPLHGGVD